MKTFSAYLRTVFRRAFTDFHFGRDMLISACLGLLTLILQVFWKLIPDWSEYHWRWLGSVGLPFIAFLAGDAIWRILSSPWRLHQEHECVIAKLKSEVVRERDSRERLEEEGKLVAPQVLLECVWPQISTVSYAFDIVRNRLFILRNTNGAIAFHVQVHDILIGDYLARFDGVAKIEDGTPIYVTPKIAPLHEKAMRPGTKDLEIVISETYFQHLHNAEQLIQIIPIRITFSDFHGNKYETNHELHYDGWIQQGEMRFKNFHKI